MSISNYFDRITQNLKSIEDNKDEIDFNTNLIKQLSVKSFSEPFSYLQNTNDISVAKKKINNLIIENNEIEIDIEGIPKEICKVIGKSVISFHTDRIDRIDRIENIQANREKKKRYFVYATSIVSISSFLFIGYNIYRRRKS